jgi:hypothetical protein
VHIFSGLYKCTNNTEKIINIENRIMNIFLVSLDFAQGITYNDPHNEPSGWNINTNGMSVHVIILFQTVQSFLGFVSHNKSSANCIPHHPIKEIPIH